MKALIGQNRCASWECARAVHFHGIFASYRDELAREAIRADTCSLLMHFRRAGTRARPWFVQKDPRKAVDRSKSVCCLHWPQCPGNPRVLCLIPIWLRRQGVEGPGLVDICYPVPHAIRTGISVRGGDFLELHRKSGLKYWF